jgi:hypothetical protein
LLLQVAGTSLRYFGIFFNGYIIIIKEAMPTALAFKQVTVASLPLIKRNNNVALHELLYGSQLRSLLTAVKKTLKITPSASVCPCCSLMNLYNAHWRGLARLT